ncbi:hypothetical protein GH714_017147 [Hevea brasiliensis]|uniref:C-JID domain-containing protein n=1 Tax=Hevea brasiliensis TaxID=3981 RepID=A0A6A6L9F3_HEVBR|nr:hypothetical protein GH714_017147 [Hevea brasiliensis]
MDLPESLHLLKFLRTTNFSGCSSITKFPDISTNIQFLYLSETGIEELPSTIGELSKLSCLDLKNCKRLKNIPCTISKLASLEKLIVSGCSSINKFPEVSKSIKKLFLCGTAIEEIPSSIEYCSELVELSMQNCKKFRILPSCICKLKSLQKLILSGCSIFECFPEILEAMGSLRCLYLDGTAIMNLPSPIENLKGLSSLELRNCKRIQGLAELMSIIDSSVAKHDIMAYALTKFQLYSKRLHNQMPSVRAGESGFCFPGSSIPKWFSHQSWGLSMTIQLPSHWANNTISEMIMVTATISTAILVVAMVGIIGGRGLWNSSYILWVDPFVDVTRDDWFGKYSKLLVEFYPEDMNGYPLVCSNVISCGVRMLYSQEESFCQCSFINRHVEAWSKTEVPMCYDEEHGTIFLG